MFKIYTKSCQNHHKYQFSTFFFAYVFHNPRNRITLNYFSSLPSQDWSKQETLEINNENRIRELINKHQDKIIYSSYIEDLKLKLGFRKNKMLEMKMLNRQKTNAFAQRQLQPLPASLKYIVDTKKEPEREVKDDEMDIVNQRTHLPFHQPVTVETVKENETHVNSSSSQISDAVEKVPHNWMSDYEVYSEEIDEGETESWKFNYGTPNPNSKVSNVPCGGCGALLHCKDTSIPGYLPSEIYENVSNRKLASLICQRCHFLKTYNLALQVNVAPEEYPRMLSTIQSKRALVVLMVDLLDFPCSIWPNIVEIIGYKRPVIVVGNKVDLLPKDSRGYLMNIKAVLEKSVMETGISKANIKHVGLISAKTGYGVEELVNKLHNCWEYKGDVYLMGCTNVGKSTLFNALLQSDYCKVQAVDLVQRATISQWPGTTLNLLKFPILRPSGWRLYVRTKRLISEKKAVQAERALRLSQLRETKNPMYASLIGHIGRTFSNEEPVDLKTDPFSVGSNPQVSTGKLFGLNERAPEYKESKWCFDTPGVIHGDQVLNLLTTEELSRTLSKELIKPRTFSIKPNHSIFIAGLARLDYLNGPLAIRFTIFTSNALPITICETEHAAILYKTFVGSDVLCVPQGTDERMQLWPALDSCDELKIIGKSWSTSAADVVLSSIGWIAITPGPGIECTIKAWTPQRRGIYVRESLLPQAVNLRGKKIRFSPAYRNSRFFIG